MKRFFKGFTLAEVLITLSIIGVVASLTLPTLQTNVRDAQFASALAKAINTLETANMLALQEGGARTLNQLGNNLTYFDTILADQVNFTRSNLAKPYKNADGNTAYNLGTNSVYTTKDGIAFLRNDNTTLVTLDSRLRALPLKYSGSYFTVYVDVNGNNKGPNVLNKDLYKLCVDTKGSVMQVGSQAYNEYRGLVKVELSEFDGEIELKPLIQ